MPNVKLVIGSEIPIEPAQTGDFVDGVWAGTIRVLEPGQNVRLQADDLWGRISESNAFDVESGTLPTESLWILY